MVHGGPVIDDLDLLEEGADKLLFEHLMAQVAVFYKARQVEVEDSLTSPAAARVRGGRLLDDFKRLIGEMPESRHPLNAKITGVLKCDGYTIEKVMYESRPEHRVTANLYRPSRGEGPFPAVAVACGHSASGKAAESYQAVCALLALNGFIVLIYDPICQGERHQILKSHWHGTTTHSVLNTSSLLVGRTIAGYELWDGIRGIDYMLSREDVSKAHPISLTGNSGGGTQVNYLMAYDGRVGPAAPSCYIMRKHRKFETIGSADGCQFLPGEVACGIDHVDYFWMRAPKPTRILAAEKDFFDFKATRDAADEAGRLYAALGVPDQTDLVSCDGRHGFAKPLREAATEWMLRWSVERTVDVVEPELTIQEEADLRVMESGQVLKSFTNEQSVVIMNRDRAKQLGPERKAFWINTEKADCLAKVSDLIALPAERKTPRLIRRGVVAREGYQLQKYLIEREGEMPLPSLYFQQDNVGGRKRKVILFVSGEGKSKEALPGGDCEAMVKNGWSVFSVDMRGYGETAEPAFGRPYLCDEYRTASISFQLGRPLIGQRVGDILSAVDVLLAQDDIEEVHLLGKGQAGTAALHAAALDPRIKSLRLKDSLTSWISDVIEKPLAKDVFGQVVPGALHYYDLPDLVNVIGPRPVELIDPDINP
jgi:cephalosporin-C deacetylase-like acetyl esterase